MFSPFGRRGAVVSLALAALVLSTLGPPVAARSGASDDPAGSKIPARALAGSGSTAKPIVAAERVGSSSDEQLIACREMLALVEQAATDLVVPGGPGGWPTSADVRSLVDSAREVADARTGPEAPASDAPTAAALAACRGVLGVLAAATDATLRAPSAAAGASASAYSISGTVTGEGAGPLAGVWAMACPYSGPGTCGGSATAGDGSYVIPGLSPASYRVWFQDPQGAFARGYYSSSGLTQDPASATPVPVVTGNVTGIDVTLPPGYRVSGAVTAQGGGGLASVQVTACPTTNGTCASTLTTGDGTYVIAGLGASSYRVSFSDPNGAYGRGYYGPNGFTPDLSAAASLELPPSRTGIDVALPSAYRISGIVTAPGGDGVQGVYVTACPSAAGMCGSAMSTSNGSYSVGGLLAGAFRVEFYDPQGRYVRGWYSASGFTQDYLKATLVSVVSGDVTGIDTTLPPGYRIDGTVRGSSGWGLAGIDVMISGPVAGSATTNTDGTYSIGGLWQGSYRVWFYDRSGSYLSGYYDSAGLTPDYSKAASVAVPPDVTLDITLPVAQWIRGTVSGASATGLGGIYVTVSSTSGGHGVLTNADGTYAIGGLWPGSYRAQFYDAQGKYVSGYYSRAGFTPTYGNATLIVVPPSATGVDVTLPLGYRIGGIVTGPGGGPLPGITVRACPSDSIGGCGSATSASDGTYSVNRLMAGSYLVQFNDPTGAHAGGYYATTGPTQDFSKATSVVVPPDASTINVQLISAAHIHGTVTASEGTRLASIKVLACPSGIGFCSTGYTDAVGTYSVGGLLAGEYRLKFSDPAGTHLTGYFGRGGYVRSVRDSILVRVPPDAAGIDVALPPASRIGGTVTMSGGPWGASIKVEACPLAGGPCIGGSVWGDGTYRVAGLPDGSYRVSFRDYGGTYVSGYYSTSGLTQDRSKATPVDVPPDASSIDVTLPVALHVTGTVLGALGPVDGVSVTACSPSGSDFCGTGVVAADGSYSVGGLSEGGYLTYFRDYGGIYGAGYYSTAGFTPEPTEASLVIVPPDRSGVDITLPAGYAISGRASGAREDDPASRIIATACATAGSWCIDSMTDDDGRYVINGLVASTYVVSFHDTREQGAFASGYYSTTGFTPDPAAASPLTLGPSATGIDVKLPGARHISGTVTGTGGVPLEGIDVTACPKSGFELCGSAVTDALGRYAVGGLVRGMYEVKIEDPTHTYADGFYNEDGFSTDHSTRVTVYVDDVTGIDMQTWRVGDPPIKYVVAASDPRPKVGSDVTVSAQLADQAGHPIAVAGMTVTWRLSGAGSLSPATSRTDAKGIATVVFTMAGSPGQVRTITATDADGRTGGVTISRREVR